MSIHNYLTFFLSLLLSFTLGYFVESSNRKAFVNKKIIAALTRQREQHLVQQQEEQENLIHSIFPPDVAKVLVKKKKKDLKTSSHDLGIKHNPSLFRTVGTSMQGWLSAHLKLTSSIPSNNRSATCTSRSLSSSLILLASHQCLKLWRRSK